MTGRGRRALALGLGLTGGLLVLFAAEAGLTLADPDPGVAAMASAAASGRPFDPRSALEVVRDLRAAGVDAVPRLVPSALLQETPSGEFHSRLSGREGELLPLSGLSHRTTVLCNETGRYAIYESDAHGFRNPRGLWERSPVDLVLVGDSFTLGDCVGPGETSADRLRAVAPATLNLGFSGHSPLMELATLAEYGPMLAPRTTLWVYFENDLSWFDLGKSGRSPLLRRYLEPGFTQGLASRRPEIDRLLEALIPAGAAVPDAAGPVSRLHRARGVGLGRLVPALKLRRLRERLRRIRPPVLGTHHAPDYALFGAVLERARQLVRSWNGRLVLVYLPGVWRFEPDGRAPRYAPLEAPQRVEAIATDLGLRFIDVEASMRDHPDPLSLYSFRGGSVIGSPHLDRAGHAHAARVIARALELGTPSARRGAPQPDLSPVGVDLPGAEHAP